MENELKYNTAFLESFDIDEAAVKITDLEYESIVEWDSVGHMGLIAEIEEAFGIELEMDDVIDFGSYIKGKEILKKYGVEI
jgi:acyl carrier protein